MHQLHFSHQYRISDLWWPKEFSRKQREIFNIPVKTRANRDLESTLYVKLSDYCLPDHQLIGKGLFSIVTFGVQQHITYFSNINVRSLLGRGGYAIKMSKNTVLDCFNFKSSCKASMANDSRGIIHKVSSMSAVSNCKVVIDRNRNTARLVTTKNIPANTEMLWNYGNSYFV